MHLESRPGSLSGLSDDRLGTIAVSLNVAELLWAPDVTPAVMDRISRDALTYPEQFDRRPASPPPPPPLMPPSGRSAKRAVGRLAVFAVILGVVVALVVAAATASGADATAAAGRILIALTEVA